MMRSSSPLSIRERFFPRHTHDRVGSKVLFALTLIPVILLVGVALGLLIKSLPLLREQNLWGLLSGTQWKPMKGQFGFLPFISATLWVTLLALVIAVPPSILTALYLAEYASKFLRALMRPVLDLLAAIPSVIYGVWGMLVIVPWVEKKMLPFADSFAGGIPLLQTDNPTGFGILAGAVVLAVMVAPFIIAVTNEVLIAVPDGIRQASLALGATRYYTIRKVLVPSTLPGIFASVVLGFSRALGETMAVLMVVGNVVQMPHSILDAAYPLPALIANNYGEMMSIPMYDSALMGAALILLGMVLILNVASTLILRRLMGRVRRAW
ncbi:MAG TPA: phosphate ABC transporter permease subunit PstC [Anaerolineaceae bacterium]|nr:phosphate ABC transporter permease subunit PstC [Anaerolineaceae bacterium]HOV07020.1 phosphate ABC transporter permease subunit PstC [Anaerolineaceae bacterium]